MQFVERGIRTLVLILALGAGTAWGALPDPIQFEWAVERNDIGTVKSWLDEGLPVEFQGNQIGTGLMVAAWHGNIPMMALFMERGANPRRSNRHGEQPLQLAAWNGHTEAVKWLLDHGANLNRDGNYWGALHYAVFNGHTDLAKYLISRGAEVNARSPNGSTPLMMAAREGREDLAKTLLESGADTRMKNDWGDTPLTMAMRYDHYKLGKMISSPEEFDIAVKAPKETFGAPTRSAAAPSEVEIILKKIREAEAEGRPTDELRKQLTEAINAMRRNSITFSSSSRRPMPLPYQPKSIVITAKRNKAGAEKAQVFVNGQPAASPVISSNSANAKPGTRTPAIKVSPVDQRAQQAQISELMRQIRLAEAQGRPADDLRRQLFDLVEQTKQ